MNKIKNVQMLNLEIEKFQEVLVPLVQKFYMNKEICFTSDFYKQSESGYSWLLKNNLNGNFLVDFYNKKPNWYVNLSEKVANDYQKVIVEYFRLFPEYKNILIEEVKNSLFGNLYKWGGCLLESNLLNYEEIDKLKIDFENLINRKKDSLFGYFHGNIIGDHIFVTKEKVIYLLGMQIVVNVGNGYYDLLRSLDWIFLKSESDEKNFNFIVEQMKEKTKNFDWQEVKLIFALRCIGILGWDMINRGDFGVGNKDKKVRYFLKFIKRNY